MSEDQYGDHDNYIHFFPQVTFLKNVYRRHTDFYCSTETFEFVNNRLIIPADENLSVMSKVWINNIDNIKTLKLFIINSDIDPNTIDINHEDLDNQDHIINSTNGNHIADPTNMFNFGTDINPILLVHKVDRLSLEIYDRLITKKSSENNWKHIPCGNLCMVPKLLEKNGRKLLFIIDQNDANVKNSIKIKFYVSNNGEEISKFDYYAHEYLIKRWFTYKHTLEIGENNIKFDVSYKTLPFLFVVLDKSDTNDVQIKYTTRGASYNDRLIRNITLCKSTEDPEMYWLDINNKDIYLLDAGNNISSHNSAQPCGVISIGKNDDNVITINTSRNVDVVITYVTFDVLRFFNGKINNVYLAGFHYGKDLPVTNSEADNTDEQQEDIPTPLGLTQLPIPNNSSGIDIFNYNTEVDNEINNQFDIVPTHENETNDDNESEDYSVHDQNNTNSVINVDYVTYENHQRHLTEILKKSKILKNMISEHEIKNAKIKLLPQNKSECQISWNQIKNGEYYYECTKCKNVFDKQSLDDWMCINHYDITTCPYCRDNMYEYPILYKNMYEIDSLKNNLIKFVEYHTKKIITLFFPIEHIKIPQC